MTTEYTSNSPFRSIPLIDKVRAFQETPILIYPLKVWIHSKVELCIPVTADGGAYEYNCD